jgi:hypothetical protein
LIVVRLSQGSLGVGKCDSLFGEPYLLISALKRSAIRKSHLNSSFWVLNIVTICSVKVFSEIRFVTEVDR